MSSTNTNDAGLEDRLTFVHKILRDAFEFTIRQVKSIAYEENFPFPYNNFVYVVDVEPQSAAHARHQNQPGTQDIPIGLHEFILRLPNPVSGYNDQIRVENEVAALSLARNALEKDFPNVVPRVFGWGSASGDKQGWVLQEYMPGSPLHAEFPNLSGEHQRALLGQMAEMLGCLQRYQIPKSVRSYGGLTFDESGLVVSAPMSILDDGPFETYEALVLGTIQSKLLKADRDERVNGWRSNGIRARLDSFLGTGVGSIMRKFTKLDKVLVHADFSTDNVLYDPGTMSLTAVFDFDFAHIGTVADDFFRSLGHGIGRFPDPRDGEATLALNKAMLQGFPDEIPPSTDNIEWPVAKAWDDAIREHDLDRPASIPGFEGLSELFWLSSQILPFRLTEKVVVDNSTEEQLVSRKADGERLLDGFLKDHGY